MAIACVYCGGRHETSAEVRRCWERSNAGDEASVIPHDHSLIQAVPRLGRNVIVGPGQSAPDGWAAASHYRIGSAEVGNPTSMIAELRHLADSRTSCVFEIDEASAVALSAAQTNSAPIDQLGPRFTFELSDLYHLLWSNSIDARRPEHASWPPVLAAIGLGATPGVGARRRRRHIARWDSGVARRRADPVHRADRRHRGAAPDRSRARGSAAVRFELLQRRSGRRSACRGHPSGGCIARDRAGRFRQDPRAHRTCPPPAHWMAPARSRGVSGRVQQASPGGDEREGCRPCRLAGTHAQCDRSGHRQRFEAVRASVDHGDHDHRTRRPATDRQARRVPAQAQLRSRGSVDRGVVVGPTGAARSA